MKTQHAQMILSDPIWNEKHHSFYHRSNDTLSDSNHPLEIDEDDMESSSSSTDKQHLDSDEIVLIA
jgi:hypothetical protein